MKLHNKADPEALVTKKEAQAIKKQLKNILVHLLNELSEKEQYVLISYYIE